MRFDAADRAVLAALADLFIPAGERFPAASQAGVAAEGLDAVLAARPDLEAGLRRVLEAARGRDPAQALAAIREGDPAGFEILAELVPGAYFMNADVRNLLGYQGQGPRPIGGADLDPELLRPVLERGRIYRPTPPAAPR